MAVSTLVFLVIVAEIARRLYRLATARPSIDTIPSAMGHGACDFQTGLWAYLTRAPSLLQQGYQNTKATTGKFKIPVLSQWWIVLTRPDQIEEIVRSKDDSVSSLAAVDDLLQLSSSIASTILTNPYHLALVQTRLNKRLDYFVPEILDEIPHAFKRTLGTGSASLAAHAVFPPMICQLSNRMLVGPSKCRDEEYIRINVKFTSRAVSSGYILSYIPVRYRPLAARILYPPSEKRDLYNHLKPLIDERRALLANAVASTAGPDDFLKWLVEVTRNKPDDVDVTMRILHLNFAAIHTTGIICTHIFYTIASNEAWQAELRDEALNITQEHGWTKTALGEMVKADSFIKEILRFHGVASVSLNRLVVKPFTFSDSTTIPAGSMLCAPSRSVHFDDAKWARPDEFDPFRFCRGTRTQSDGMTTTSSSFLTWGHGRHACPGRFFAAHELKAILAHALLNYDISIQGGGGRPKDHWFVTACMPDSNAILNFRKRSD